MSITMRVIQRFDFKHEEDFMALERKFAELEAARDDFPKGRRMQPIAGAEWRNTLIWECEFPDLDSAQKALDFFAGDAEHDVLFRQQRPFFEGVKIEFFRNLVF
jgi:hypothetical protein